MLSEIVIYIFSTKITQRSFNFKRKIETLAFCEKVKLNHSIHRLYKNYTSGLYKQGVSI